MKAIILAGGFGTRISEETISKPKPMVEIGGMPILWHIMKIYSAHGINEFIICCGYKGYMIKEFFANYSMHMSDVTFDLRSGQMHVHKNNSESWKVTLVDTGSESMTGGRLLRVREHIKKNEDFCFTYGDGLSNVNISDLIKFHKSNNKLATMTVVRPPGRYGAAILNEDIVESFQEKPDGDGSWINGGFFVVNERAIDLIKDESVSWEDEPLRLLSKKGELCAYKHHDFWQAMDTLREKNMLNKLWEEENTPWKVWE